VSSASPKSFQNLKLVSRELRNWESLSLDELLITTTNGVEDHQSLEELVLAPMIKYRESMSASPNAEYRDIQYRESMSAPFPQAGDIPKPEYRESLSKSPLSMDSNPKSLPKPSTQTSPAQETSGTTMATGTVVQEVVQGVSVRHSVSMTLPEPAPHSLASSPPHENPSQTFEVIKRRSTKTFSIPPPGPPPAQEELNIVRIY